MAAGLAADLDVCAFFRRDLDFSLDLTFPLDLTCEGLDFDSG